MKEKGFDTLLSSGRQYEEICGELYCDGELITMLSQEQGIDKALIEIFPPDKGDSWHFDYGELTSELGKLYKRLEEGGLIEQEGRFKAVLIPGTEGSSSSAQVIYEESVVAKIESEFGRVSIQLQMPSRGGVWKFRYHEFMDYLEKAVQLVKA